MASQMQMALNQVVGFTYRLETLAVKLKQAEVVRTITRDALLEQTAAQNENVAFTLHFRSPTVLRHENRYHCLLQCDFLLGGLSRRMLDWLPDDYPMLVPEIYANALPDQYQLKTVPLPIKHINHVTFGFQGECTYHVFLPPNSASQQVLAIMLALLPFMAVGYKTAMELGSVEVISSGLANNGLH